MKKLFLLIIFIPFLGFLSAQPCLPDGITFTTQAQIDSFPVNYPGCTEIEGSVLISGDSISNLNGLESVISIGGDFQIGELYTGVPLLENLSGLNSLAYVAGNFRISSNESLLSLSGLDILDSVIGGFIIDRNDVLQNLFGLENLSSVGKTFSFYQNDNLASFAGLNNLAYVRDISIDGNGSLTNLVGFENLSYIDGSLIVYNSFALINLNGLNNVTTIMGSVDITNNWEFSSFAGLESLDSIGGLFAIHGNDELVDFSGLNNLISIGGLLLFGNYSIMDFTGLENLTSINGILQVSWNESLENFSGLNGVTAIDGDIVIYYNYALSSLEGIENIGAETIGNLSIHHNFSLSNCDVESICNYLASPNGMVSIYKNDANCNSPVEIANGCGITLDCLPFGHYYFQTQQEIDSFKNDFPNCDDLKGNVQISGDDINDLFGLSEVSSIEGSLNVKYNTSLVDFTGLYSLTTIGNHLSVGGYEGEGNPILEDFNGLGNLNNVGGNVSIYFNEALENLSGLDGLSAIGSLEIVGNNSLVNLNGINNLDSIFGNLQFNSNINLANLIGLENLSHVGKYIMVSNNDSLKSLEGLDNINANSIVYIDINGNTSLSKCNVKSICDYLILPEAWVSIENNEAGCNSLEEVEDACLVLVNEKQASKNLSVYPNPFTTSTTIEYELKQAELVTLSIYNCFGEKVELIQEKQPVGKQQLVWNAKGLPACFYFCTIQTENMSRSVKLIKQ